MGAKRLGFGHLIASLVLMAAVILLYFAVIPNVIARNYQGKFEAELSSVNSTLKEISSTVKMPVFNDPDLSFSGRHSQLNEAMQKTLQAQKKLKEFDSSTRLSVLPGASLAEDYHTAEVRRELAMNAVRQSRQVLAEYAQVLQYLNASTSLQIELESHLAYVNGIRDFNPLKGQGGIMAGRAAAIREDEKILVSLMPPADFAGTHAETLKSYNQAASGYDSLARGLNRGVDSEIYGAVSRLEEAAIKLQVNDKNLLVSQTDSSPTLRQVAELPEKLEHVREP